jgi:hypothetical protein
MITMGEYSFMMPFFSLPSGYIIMHQLHYSHRIHVFCLLEVTDALQSCRKALLASLNGFLDSRTDFVVKHAEI